jgi:hypothetical protein
MSKRLSAERIEELRRHACVDGGFFKADTARSIMEHVAAVEAELTETWKAWLGASMRADTAESRERDLTAGLAEARAEIARLAQQLASRDAEIEGRLKGVR